MLNESNKEQLRVAFVIASLSAGGIGPVCRYAAEGIARQTGWEVTLLSLHDTPSESRASRSGVRTACLGLDHDCAQYFLRWLGWNPQELIVSSDVSRIESTYPFLPSRTRHIVQLHDSSRRYRAVALRHALSIDGIMCVAHHIENRLGPALAKMGFEGLLRTIHNGAHFPPLPPRTRPNGALRLLYMGRLDPLKGVSDLAPLLKGLERLGVPVRLNIVGGDNEALRRRFRVFGFDQMVTWSGHVRHERCYEIAAESDILLMVSRKEPFGMVTIEAMSMGCVPIAYDVPSGNTEIIEHGKSGLLVPLGDIPAWAEEIRALSADRDRLAHLSAGAVKRARESFNAEIMSKKMGVFIQDVITNARPHPARRELGPLSEGSPLHRKRGGIYQRLPASLRSCIRTLVGRSPKLCYWWLNR
jgi:glycosyltransferase involved in cell wall biosynthesis